MNQTYVNELKNHIGKEVTLKGWLYNTRSSGKLAAFSYIIEYSKVFSYHLTVNITKQITYSVIIDLYL